MRDRIVILMAAVMIATGLIMTNPVTRVRSNTIVASPHFAVQVATGDDPYYRPAPIYPGGQGGWFGSVIGGWFGSLAGSVAGGSIYRVLGY